MLFPVGLGKDLCSCIEERIGIRSQDARFLETEESTSDFEEPGILSSIVEAIHVTNDGADLFARIDALRQRGLAHTGGVSQLGVIVITEDVHETARNRGHRLNMGMRVDQGNGAECTVQIFDELIHGR